MAILCKLSRNEISYVLNKSRIHYVIELIGIDIVSTRINELLCLADCRLVVLASPLNIRIHIYFNDKFSSIK